MSNTVVIADASPLIALARINHLHRNCKTTDKPTRLIIDDAKGRAAARRLSLALIGSAGIIATAKRLNLIPHARPLLEQLRASVMPFKVEKSIVYFSTLKGIPPLF